MRYAKIAAVAALMGLAFSTHATLAGDYYNGYGDDRGRGHERADPSIQLGPRPFYLVQGMDNSPLKSRLLKCQDGPFRRINFSIAHRGALPGARTSTLAAARCSH